MFAKTTNSLSLAEAEQFVDFLYGRQNILSISNEHYTVIEDTGVTNEFVCNNNCDNEDEDVKLHPLFNKLCPFC